MSTRTRPACLGVAWLSLVCGCTPGDGADASVPYKGPRVPALHLGMTVEEAYAAVSVQRTELDLTRACIDPGVRWYVEAVFSCIDEAVVLRVVTQNEFLQGQRAFRMYELRHERLSEYLESLIPPAPLDVYHDRILEAFEAQRALFAAWTREGRSLSSIEDVFSRPEARLCSLALEEARRIIEREIGADVPDQIEAFRDYHRALAFSNAIIR